MIYFLYEVLFDNSKFIVIVKIKSKEKVRKNQCNFIQYIQYSWLFNDFLFYLEDNVKSQDPVNRRATEYWSVWVLQVTWYFVEGLLNNPLIPLIDFYWT